MQGSIALHLNCFVGIHIFVIYIRKKEVLSEMKIENIVDLICDILFIYYNKYMETYRNISREITTDIHNKVCNILIDEFNRRYRNMDVIPEVESIDILSFTGYDKTYYCDELKVSDASDMIELISGFMKDDNYIIKNNFDYVMSINVCPFDGLEIHHDEIMWLFNTFFT